MTLLIIRGTFFDEGDDLIYFCSKEVETGRYCTIRTETVSTVTNEDYESTVS